jgi:hypothetical protein
VESNRPSSGTKFYLFRQIQQTVRETFSSHFLKYSGKAAYQTPRLSEFDLVSAIASHYPNHIGRALISSNANTIQSALSFLRRIEALETNEYGQGRSEPSTSAQRSPNSKNRQENYRPQYEQSTREGRHVRNVTMNRDTFPNRNNDRYNNVPRSRGEPNRAWRSERRFDRRSDTSDRKHRERRLNANAPIYRPNNNPNTGNTTTDHSENRNAAY